MSNWKYKFILRNKDNSIIPAKRIFILFLYSFFIFILLVLFLYFYFLRNWKWYRSSTYDTILDNNDIFSPADMTDNDNRGITGYLTTPNGSSQKYDPTQPQGKRNSTISDQMPYDPKHPNPLKPKKQEWLWKSFTQ